MKTKTLKLMSIALALIFALSLAACGGDSDGNNTALTDTSASEETPDLAQTPEETPEATSSSTDTPEETSAPVAEGLPENLEDFTITLDGDTIRLPISFEDFMDLGWKADNTDIEQTLESGQFAGFIRVVKDDKFLYVYAANILEDQPLTLRQSTIYGINIDIFQGDWEFPHNIKRNVSSLDDVIAAYGELHHALDEGFVSYIKDAYAVSFTFEDDVLKVISILSMKLDGLKPAEIVRE